MTITNSARSHPAGALPYFSERDVFRLSGLVGLVAILAFFACRGFGWDGDTIKSGIQFIALFKHGWYGQFPDTAPKSLTIPFAGVSEMLTGGIVPVLMATLLLQAWMIAELCAWTRAEGGYWWLALIGLAINVRYLYAVVEADTPALSIPLAAIALSYHFHRKRTAAAAGMLFVSALLRPGAELILPVLAIFTWRDNRRAAIAYALMGGLGILASAFSYLWIVPHQHLYIDAAHEATPQFFDPVYRYSLLAAWPYLEALGRLLIQPPIVVFVPFAVWGIVVSARRRSGILGLLLLAVGTYGIGALSFLYGLYLPFPAYVLEYTIVVMVFMAFCRNPFADRLEASLGPRAMLAGAAGIAVAASVAGGISLMHFREVTEDGTGITRWYHSSQATQLLRTAVRADSQPRIYLGCGETEMLFLVENWRRLGVLTRNIEPCAVLNYAAIRNADIALIARRPIDPGKLGGFDIHRLEHGDYMIISHNITYTKK